jgi:hypothetical protein
MAGFIYKRELKREKKTADNKTTAKDKEYYKKRP